MKPCSLCGSVHLLPLDSAVVERAAIWLDRYTHEAGMAFFSTMSEADREACRVGAKCLLSTAFESGALWPT